MNRCNNGTRIRRIAVGIDAISAISSNWFGRIHCLLIANNNRFLQINHLLIANNIRQFLLWNHLLIANQFRCTKIRLLSATVQSTNQRNAQPAYLFVLRAGRLAGGQHVLRTVPHLLAFEAGAFLAQGLPLSL